MSSVTLTALPLRSRTRSQRAKRRRLSEIMKIAVMGAGAIGCYFGGRLLAAGEDVSFIARGPAF
jgi:pyruvate/2-oxoglutarate dehydrogenase complex dihydrolipoamide dehydrogenase (E3) component